MSENPEEQPKQSIGHALESFGGEILNLVLPNHEFSQRTRKLTGAIGALASATIAIEVFHLITGFENSY